MHIVKCFQFKAGYQIFKESWECGLDFGDSWIQFIDIELFSAMVQNWSLKFIVSGL